MGFNINSEKKYSTNSFEDKQKVNRAKENTTEKAVNEIAEKYANSFAILFGVSVNKAKQLLSSEKFINQAKYATSVFSEYLVSMDKYQAADFFKSLNSKDKAFLAIEAQRNGIASKELQKVFKAGSVSNYFEQYEKNGKKKENIFLA